MFINLFTYCYLSTYYLFNNLYIFRYYIYLFIYHYTHYLYITYLTTSSNGNLKYICQMIQILDVNSKDIIITGGESQVSTGTQTKGIWDTVPTCKQPSHLGPIY